MKNNKIIGIVLIFIVILLAIIFMPNINTLFNNKEENSIKDIILPIKKDEELNEVKIYDLTSDLVINRKELTLSNVSYEENILKFDVTNISGKTIDNEDKFFIELYDNTRFIKRYLLVISKLGINQTTSFNYYVTNINKISLVKKSINDYPFYEVGKNSDNKYVLSCNSSKTDYTYYFDETNKLKSITSMMKVFSLSDNYLETKIDYKNKAINLDLINGIDATFQETLEGFDYIVKYDLSSVNVNDLNDSTIFQNDTLSKVVKFEMESQDYSCK